MRPDVIVVGGGVVGLAVARELAGGGQRVIVVDRGIPGREASWAAAGMLAPQAEADRDDAFFALLCAARALYPTYVEILQEETGFTVGYRSEGMLFIALDAGEAAELEARADWQGRAGLTVDRLTAEEALALEPALTRELRGALLFPGDHQVDNRILTDALWAATRRLGVEVRSGAEVSGVRVGAASARVELAGGERLEGESVVIAAGSWSGLIAGLPRPLPVEPVHGQLVALEAEPAVLRHVIGAHAGYLVPRSDGRLIAGTTVSRSGFLSSPTAGGVQQVLAGAFRMAPALARLPIHSHWSGLRPGTPDGWPILGPDPSEPRVFYATGHYRNGILLAPITAKLVAAAVRGEAAELDPFPFSIGRFD
jgi:glycine oxidase